MLSPDAALLALINRTASAYVANAPTYITYQEHTHVAASIGRAQDINRAVAVRQADDFAVMQDLPSGALRTGQAFPLIPYFDPFTSFGFSWFANLKNVQVTLLRGPVGPWVTPTPDPSVNVLVPYLSFYYPEFLPDSTPQALDLRMTPTASFGKGLYTYEVRESAATQLPSHIELRATDDPEIIDLDYQVLQGHWVITKATFTAPEHYGPLNFTIAATTTFDDMAFPASAPDPRLAGTPAPTPTP